MAYVASWQDMKPHTCDTCHANNAESSYHLADAPGAAISLPWDFLPKVLATFSGSMGKGYRRAEACSGDNIWGVNNLL